MTEPRDVTAPDVGSQIRHWRTVRGLTQDDLAARLDTTQATVSRWESGDRQPGLDDLRGLAKALKVPAGELLEPTERTGR